MEVKTIRRANSNSTILYNKKLRTLLCFSFPISLYVLCRYVKVYIFLGTKYGRTCQGRYSDYGDISEAPIHLKKLVSDSATRHSIEYIYIRTFAQSICTHYFCFENMGQFVNLKKVPKYGLQKAGCKKQGHYYSRREYVRLPLLCLNINDPVFCTLLLATHILDLF